MRANRQRRTGAQLASRGCSAATFAARTVLFLAIMATACDRQDSVAGPENPENLPLLGTATHYTSNGMRLGKVLVGDVNSDGLNDVVVKALAGGLSRVLIYYQNTRHELDPPTVLPVLEFEAQNIAIGDLNSDGGIDIAVIGRPYIVLGGYLGKLLVYWQDPQSHNFGPSQLFPVSSNNPIDVAIGDLNSDGRADVVASGLWVVNPGQGRLSVRYQQDGGDLGGEHLNDSVGVAAGQITIGDVTGDGRNDIVVQSGLLELAVVPQLSNGTMSGSPDQYTIQTSYWPRFDAFAVGDLNGDTGNDVVVLDPGNSGFVNLFIQQAGGGLTRSTPFQLGVPPFAVGIADIDDNGLNDIVGLDVAPGAPYGIGMVSVYYQEATHAFLPAIVYRFDTTSGGGSSEHQLLAIGDVTGDGWPDVVAGWADEGIWVLPGVRR